MIGSVSTDDETKYIAISGMGESIEIAGAYKGFIRFNFQCSKGNYPNVSVAPQNCGRPFCYIDKSGSISSGDCLLYRFLGTGDEIVPTHYILLRDGVEVDRGGLPTGTISVGPHPNQELRMYNPNCGCRNPQAHYTTF